MGRPNSKVGPLSKAMDIIVTGEQSNFKAGPFSKAMHILLIGEQLL